MPPSATILKKGMLKYAARTAFVRVTSWLNVDVVELRPVSGAGFGTDVDTVPSVAYLSMPTPAATPNNTRLLLAVRRNDVVPIDRPVRLRLSLPLSGEGA